MVLHDCLIYRILCLPFPSLSRSECLFSIVDFSPGLRGFGLPVRERAHTLKEYSASDVYIPYLTGEEAEFLACLIFWWALVRPVLLPGKSHGRRSLEGCSPWGLWGSDRTERLHFHFSLSCIGEDNGNPLQCSCLENPRGGEAWWAAVYGVAQSRTGLKRLSSSSSSKTWAVWSPSQGPPAAPSCFLSSLACLHAGGLVS